MDASHRAASLPALPGDDSAAAELPAHRPPRLSPTDQRKGSHRNGWTPARVETVKALIERGFSAARIAKELGLPRNAVIGKCHRLGIKLASPVPLAKPHPLHKPLSRQKNRGRGMSKDVPFVALHLVVSNTPPVLPIEIETAIAAAAELAPAPTPAPPRRREGVPLLKRADDGCMWSIGHDHRGHLFCNQPRYEAEQQRCPYCEAHARKAYEPVRRRR